MGKIRLVRADRQGALFEFPAERLTEPSFRTAMPRQCVRCSSQVGLHVHVILYCQQLTDSFTAESAHKAGSLVLRNPQIMECSPEEVLARLPNVPGATGPASLPMPYWLCEMCSGEGMIASQIQVNPLTGIGWCRLLIHNLRVAASFLAEAGGEGTPGHADLRKRIRQAEEDPWDLLPSTVQHRLQQWYKPTPDEQFVAYVPDRSHSRAEDGMTGVVVSTARLIYHTHLRHHEIPVAESFELRLAMTGANARLRITAQKWETRNFTLDREGIGLLRKGLKSARFRVQWH
jgi:hypothetical protein